MTLQKYLEKRDFTQTNEPISGKKKGKELRFVVQRHHASHLHYDFRLEMEGVLKSWAVPKGPSLNPKDKRLAMMVEDHPYDYRTFEGVIPEGNYGAGVVTIFDEGTYESLEGKNDEKALLKGLYSGNLKFRLKGKVLKGEFALVKLKDAEPNSWLLIKHKDEFAVDKKFNSEDLVPETVKKKGVERKKKAGKKNLLNISKPAEIEEKPELKTEAAAYKPMLAKLSSDVFDNDEWIYEKKLDGYRAIAVTEKSVKLISRNGIDFSEKYEPVTKALSKINNEAVIDGELVVEDKNGISYFQEIQNYNSGNKNFSLKYYVFDLLALDKHDLRSMELVKRKELLKALIEQLNDPVIIFNEHIKGKGIKLFAEAEEKKWEGIIAKKASSLYESGKRSDSWLKFKLQSSQEAVIIGFTKPAGSRKYFGSLVLGMYEGEQLIYIGNCGTGFNETSLKELYNLMLKLKTDRKPVSQKVHQEKTTTWLKPELVCEVTFTEWTADNHLRHPVFKGLRTDKESEEIHKENNIFINKTEKTQKETPKEMPGELEENFGKKKLKLTNLNKLYWKKEGITKGQLIDYYRQVSPYILPYLKDRALSLNRHPNGIDAPGFFQKDLDTEQIPSWIKYAPLYSESNDKDIDYLVCNDEPTLLWMANLGCIEINPWLSTYKKPDNPIFAVMDLDPQDVDFREVVRVALTIKEILNEMGIKPFIKTSGSRGLHIFIHIGAKYDYEQSKNFIQYLGHLVMAQHPDTTSLERSPSKRKNKIYLDFLQNRRGQTIAAPYSARPKPGATVSTPIEWDEVNEDLDIKNFTIFNTLDRLKEKGDLWKDITECKNDLKKALEKLK
ncbi:DNA ligase D [Rubrolithibacter danxiaensis]|uniref:DNA ligase D n=1 Tax=Rubrolithibacter danxiaensis TaxID=3390805 RepID=UPI003BF83168